MSYAAEHPVYCAQREAAGCRAQHPGSRRDAMKADRAGWFHSYQEEQAYCPAHVPGWVPAWRKKREARLHKVKKSFTKLPAVVKCDGCALHRTEASEDPDVLAELRDVAWLHARQTGHTVTVTTSQELAVTAED